MNSGHIAGEKQTQGSSPGPVPLMVNVLISAQPFFKVWQKKVRSEASGSLRSSGETLPYETTT